MKAAEGNDHNKALLDQAVLSKVLPRVRGQDSPRLRTALETAKMACERRHLERSARKLGDMLESLKRTGMTRFWS